MNKNHFAEIGKMVELGSGNCKGNKDDMKPKKIKLPELSEIEN